MARPDAPDEPADSPMAGSRRGRVGFFQVARDDGGPWWLLDPEARPVFLRGVNGVRAAGSQEEGALPLDAAARLRRWGFNALGVRADGGVRDDGLPFMAAVEFSRVGKLISAPGVRLPDVFDPEWPRLAAEHARLICGSWTESRELIGWVSDSHLEWGHAPAGRPTLLQICLSLEPSFSAYHAAWEFVLASHRGRLDALAHAWNVALPNKESVRELTRSETGWATRGYLRDDTRWSREFARRYFSASGAAMRTADPNHLILGCRFAGPAGGAVMAECGYPSVDVALVPWTELPAGVGSPAPQIAGDVCWSGENAKPEPGDRKPRRLTTFERMLRRARSQLDRMARNPNVVGYTWSQWQDDPGEQPPFARGLVHLNGTEAREHTEVLEPFNHRAEALHRQAGK